MWEEMSYNRYPELSQFKRSEYEYEPDFYELEEDIIDDEEE